MPAFTDQTGRDIYLPATPAKIISVVPSQTELLHYLGLEQEVMAITKFCIHPPVWYKSKIKIGGTKQLNLALIDQLSPDLILANKEENTREQIEWLAGRYPVWISDISGLGDAIFMIGSLGEMTGREEEANQLIQSVQTGFRAIPLPARRLRAAYLIWRQPFMTAGGDTFIHAMLQAAGFENVFKSSLRYPETTLEEIKAKKPEIILLSSEPFPFNESHVREIQPYLPEARVLLADGEMFSWYGSRLLQAPGYFQQLTELLLNESKI